MTMRAALEQKGQTRPETLAAAQTELETLRTSLAHAHDEGVALRAARGAANPSERANGIPEDCGSPARELSRSDSKNFIHTRGDDRCDYQSWADRLELAPCGQGIAPLATNLAWECEPGGNVESAHAQGWPTSSARAHAKTCAGQLREQAPSTLTAARLNKFHPR